jgi:hypothetical protein
MNYPALPTAKAFALGGLTALTLLSATIHFTHTRGEVPSLDGSWLMTVALPDERPLEVMMAFSPAGIDPRDFSRDRWTRVSAREFAIAFTMREEANGASLRKISGTLAMDELGRLRGPVTAERIGSNGRVIDSIPGVAKAKLITQKYL